MCGEPMVKSEGLQVREANARAKDAEQRASDAENKYWELLAKVELAGIPKPTSEDWARYKELHHKKGVALEHAEQMMFFTEERAKWNGSGYTLTFTPDEMAAFSGTRYEAWENTRGQPFFLGHEYTGRSVRFEHLPRVQAGPHGILEQILDDSTASRPLARGGK